MADAQLLQYIAAQKAAGYSDTQIRQALLTNGYTQAMVDDAFKTSIQSTAQQPMAQTVDKHVQAAAAKQQLETLAAQYLQAGLTPTQAIDQLASQGYSPQDARAALHETIKASEPKHMHLSYIFIIIAAMSAGGLLLMFLQQQDIVGGANSATAQVTSSSDAQVIAKILTDAQKMSKEKTVAACEQYLDGTALDDCLTRVAIAPNILDLTICEKVSDSQAHDDCLKGFLGTERIDDACSRMKLESNKQMCSDIKAAMQVQG